MDRTVIDNYEAFDIEKDIDTSSANTEACLLNSSQNSSGIITDSIEDTDLERKDIDDVTHKRKYCNSSTRLALGIVLTIYGLATIVWTPLELCMQERLRMRPGFPPYEWWKNPPDEVLLRVYVFNITNAAEFLAGNDSKLRLQEVGPIIYREKLIHTNVTFNDNDTMSYVATRKAIFLPELNTIDLNQKLVLPNLAVLGMASFLSEASFFVKLGYNILVSKSEPIVEATIQEYLWNFTDPVLEAAQKIAPGLVPTKNMGILSRIYDDFEDELNVFIGTKNSHERFFMIEKFDGSDFIPGFNPEICAEEITNSTEGVMYTQFITKKDILKYWRKTMCRVMPLHFEKEVDKMGMLAYKFSLSNSTYDRIYHHSDCYKGSPVLPNGLMDVSKCYYDFPIGASFPHFLYGDHVLKDYVDGLEPNNTKHQSFVIVEPMTGLPLESFARSQSNLIIRKLGGFNKNLQRFSDLVVPMFWAEYNQVSLPYYIQWLVYFTVRLLPWMQYIGTAIAVSIGLFVVYKSLRYKYNKRTADNYHKNAMLHFEVETFVKS